MPRGTERFLKAVKQQADVYYKVFTTRYGQQIIDLLELPVKVVLSPFTLAYDIAGSAPRGFGIPELASHLSFSAIFVVATLGTYDIALELGRKVICQRNCRTCNGWQALRCTMCKGTGKVHYQVKNYSPKSGEKATTECVAEAIVENRAELVHLPATINLSIPLPSKDCLNCDGSGVMGCPDCKRRLQVRISADDIMEPPWKAYNVITKMDYPYENIVHSMRDPKIAAFWLITMPQVLGGFNYDDDVKQKIWWAYKESMRYDQLRDAVAKRKSGWEHLQDMPPSMVPTLLDAADSPLFNVGVVAPSIIGGLPITVKPLHSYFNSQALISLDPVRARDDPVIVKNIPFYKAKKELEAEVMKLDVPRRPQNWGELDLPLNASSWTEEDLKDPKKLLEMTTLLNAQREIADKILDAQWEAKWRQDKLNDLLKEKVAPYVQSIDKGVLPQAIIIKSHDQENKKKTTTRRRWWFF